MFRVNFYNESHNIETYRYNILPLQHIKGDRIWVNNKYYEVIDIEYCYSHVIDIDYFLKEIE